MENIYHLDAKSLHKYNEKNTYSHNQKAFSTLEVGVLAIIGTSSLYLGLALGTDAYTLLLLTA